MKKAQMLPSEYLIGITIFTLVISAGVWLISSMRDVDSSFVDDTKYSQFNNTFNKYTQMRTQTQKLEESITGSEADFGPFGPLGALVGTIWNSVKLMFSNFAFMTTVFGGLYSFFGIPAFVGNLIITLVSISLVFAIFAAVLQGKL